jgi:hypothetical protein
MSEDTFFGPSDVIFSYTRQQAIDDGVLVDLTEWAKETGFRVPVACTAAVWHQYVVPPPGSESWGQSERGRAHDLLWMLFLSARKQAGSRVDFEVSFLNGQQQQEIGKFYALCGPGDQGEPVITIMLPHED